MMVLSESTVLRRAFSFSSSALTSFSSAGFLCVSSLYSEMLPAFASPSATSASRAFFFASRALISLFIRSISPWSSWAWVSSRFFCAVMHCCTMSSSLLFCSL